jgi:hypothetical protein
MSTSFQEFLRERSGPSGASERKRNREEWLAALNRLYEQIREWLREADPDEVLEVVSYRVERVEEQLGVYDAPALSISLGTDEVDVVPVGRYSIGLTASYLGRLAAMLARKHPPEGAGSGPQGQTGRFDSALSALSAVLDAEGVQGPLSGRVDVTNGERKHLLFRVVDGNHDHWYAMGEKTEVDSLDRHRLEAILQDLMS